MNTQLLTAAPAGPSAARARTSARRPTRSGAAPAAAAEGRPADRSRLGVGGRRRGVMAGRRRRSRRSRRLAGSFTAVGIVAGLAGMDLVLLMLLLAARIPFIDRTVGHDRALEFHRKLGKPALYLLLAHGLLIAVGYGMAEGLDPVSEAVALWVLVPDMWLAFVSMALFIAVVVTSLVAVRRRFPYEFWYAVHLLTYAAVLTALPHQFSVGGLFAEGTWQRWYWLAVCIATGAALLLLPGGPAAGGHVPAPADGQPGGGGGPRRRQHRNDRPAPGPAGGQRRPVLHLAVPGSRACGGIRTRSASPPSPSSSTPDGQRHAADHGPKPGPRLGAAGPR